MTGKTKTRTTYEPMFLSELIKSVPFNPISNHQSRESAGQNSGQLGTGISFERGLGLDQERDLENNYDSDVIEIPKGEGWQKMACNRCMIIWAEPPEPVKFSMICPECGDVIGREGEF